MGTVEKSIRRRTEVVKIRGICLFDSIMRDIYKEILFSSYPLLKSRIYEYNSIESFKSAIA